MAMNKELLDILACPKCKSELVLTQPEDGLICHACQVVYPIKEEIPIMLIEEAVPLVDWEAGAREQKHGPKTAR
ncbi:MAG TPA: Trm112 family protein [Desulfonatronum sp.]|nr:Trm112 family protein [Desulfonatronum sp.]